LLAGLLMLPEILPAGQNSNGGATGAFRRVGHSARLMGLGNCALAYPAGAESRQYNPALITWLGRRNLSLGMLKLSLDRQLGGVHFVLPIKPMGAVGLSWTRAAVTGIPETTTWGETTGRDLEYGENLFSFGVALQPASFLSFGLSMGVNTARFSGLDEGTNELKENAAGFDLGLAVRPHDDLWLGASLRNLAASYQWDSTPVWGTSGESAADDALPSLYGLGAGLQLYDERLLLLADYEVSALEAWKLRAGAEFRSPAGEMGRWAFRSGYDDGSLCFGVGFAWPFTLMEAGMDYAVVFHEHDPSEIHSFTWTFVF